MTAAAMPLDVVARDEAALLCAGAHQMHVALSVDQTSALQDYLTLLSRWNKVYNLTAVRDRADMLTHHLLDSLSIVAPLRHYAEGRALRLLDVGSGAGLPAMVLATVLPTWQIDSLDAVAKKVGFVRQVAAELRLPNLRGLHGRVESVVDSPGYDVVIARAFASLTDFVQGSRRALAADGVWLAMKGKQPADEIAALPDDIEVFHVEHFEVPGLDAERCGIWMRRRPVADGVH